MTDKPSEPTELSIGTLSSATGVPVDTLRTWERRYGFPVPTTRTGGSHRRYAADTIGQVRLIVRALELGHRASAVIGRDPEELQRLVAVSGAATARSSGVPDADAEVIAHWLERTRAMDGDALLGEFQRGLAELPALEFLSRRMGPYLHAMGAAWAAGELRVSQEHFASEKAREFLNAHWRGLSDASRAGAVLVLATPPGEPHTLGLHMAAWVVALAGARISFLGADTPTSEIAFAVERNHARGVVLSVAAGYRGDLRAHLRDLEARLGAGVALAVGGAGASTLRLPSILNGFEQLFQWANRLVHDAGARAVEVQYAE